MDDQRTDRESGGVTTERLSRWFTVMGWMAALAAFIFAVKCMPDDTSSYQFDSYWILLFTLVLACAVHAASVLIAALAREQEILAPRTALTVTIACLVGAWVYFVEYLTLSFSFLWWR
jgi:uncharacterized membrane protein